MNHAALRDEICAIGASLFALTIAAPAFAQTPPAAVEDDTSNDIIVTASALWAER